MLINSLTIIIICTSHDGTIIGISKIDLDMTRLLKIFVEKSVTYDSLFRF